MTIRVRFNILLAVNDKYELLARLCIKSILAVADMSRIEKIIINDTGLSAQSKARISALHSSIEYLSIIQAKSNYVGLHTPQWLATVKAKTMALKRCIQNDILPIVSLDVDQVVLADFFDLIPKDVSCVLCKRKRKVTRSDGIELDFIGSFFAALDRKSIDFVNSWIQEIHNLELSQVAPPHETPALCRVASRLINDKSLSYLYDIEVSSPNTYIKGVTRIYHYKSETSMESSGNVLLDRLSAPHTDIPDPVKVFLVDNLEIEDVLATSTSSSHTARIEWTPPTFLIEKAVSLDDLSIIFRSDKGSLKHNYTPYYEIYLTGLKDKKTKLLEVGVANGSSLKMWASYLPQAEIHGVDIDERCRELCSSWNNISILIASAATVTLADQYDIIIDDGSHISADILANFLNLWPSLKPGGIYFVEDTLCTATLTQAKYNPARNLKDYARGRYLKLIDLLLGSMDSQGDSCSVEAVHAHSQLLVIIKSRNGCARFPAEIDPQYSLDRILLIWRMRLYLLVQVYGKLKRSIRKRFLRK